jgi:hypothetical protein
VGTHLIRAMTAYPAAAHAVQLNTARILRRAGLYFRPMCEGKRRRVATWRVSRLRGTPAAFVGTVEAADEATAKERAIKQFGVRPEDRKRLIAVRHQ